MSVVNVKIAVSAVFDALPIRSTEEPLTRPNKGDTTMLNKITLALTAALILGTAPTAFAAARHHAAKAPVHGTVARAAYGANALAGGNGGPGGETYLPIQDRGWSEQVGQPHCNRC